MVEILRHPRKNTKQSASAARHVASRRVAKPPLQHYRTGETQRRNFRPTRLAGFRWRFYELGAFHNERQPKAGIVAESSWLDPSTNMWYWRNTCHHSLAMTPRAPRLLLTAQVVLPPWMSSSSGSGPTWQRASRSHLSRTCLPSRREYLSPSAHHLASAASGSVGIPCPTEDSLEDR